MFEYFVFYILYRWDEGYFYFVWDNNGKKSLCFFEIKLFYGFIFFFQKLYVYFIYKFFKGYGFVEYFVCMCCFIFYIDSRNGFYFKIWIFGLFQVEYIESDYCVRVFDIGQ